MKKSLYYLGFAFYFICAFSYVTYHGFVAKGLLLESIDKQLMQGAVSTKTILASELPDTYFVEGAINKSKDKQNILKLSEQADILGLEYIYALIMVDNQIKFIASSAKNEELKLDENISHYFDSYENNSTGLRTAFGTKKPIFDDASDAWGNFRSVYVPFTTKNGQEIILGADLQIDFINQEINRVIKQSLYEVIFFTIILLPLFMAYSYNSRTIKKDLELTIKEKTTQIKTLLDNADQGFLSFSDDFLVHPEYSIICSEIFADDIAGLDIASLLFKEDSERGKFKDTLLSLIGDEDSIRVETMLSLLPKEFNINSKIITAEYKMVANSDFMIILTDITEKRSLEKKLDKEQKVLKMVVSSVASTSELFELLKEYKEFMSNRVSLIDTSKTPLNNLTELYRAVHTFKGNFAQKDFIVTPQGLHKLETRLSKFLSDPNTTNEAVISVLKKVELEDWFNKDINILKQVLGDDFFDDESKIVISSDKLEELKERIKNTVGELGLDEHMLDTLVSEIEFLKQKSLYEALLPYVKTVEQVALKLEKNVYPMHIECDRNIFIDDKYKPFIRSLVHVFRNSIDHGLEYADVRAENGKDEFGTISCIGSIDENRKLKIVIADDGDGINIQKVAQKAVENSICTQEEIDKMSDNEIAMLIFSDNFSTKDEVSELSGRGVGLGAVKAELEALGGNMSIATIKGKGSTFIFSLASKEE